MFFMLLQVKLRHTHRAIVSENQFFQRALTIANNGNKSLVSN